MLSITKKPGLKIIIVDKEKYPNPQLPYARLYDDAKFSIYQPKQGAFCMGC